MAMREEYRPFNAEQAKVGAPYGLINGEYYVNILYFGEKLLIGMYSFAGLENDWDAAKWGLHGSMLSSPSTSRYDLLMLPIAHCQDKPVYVGDTLYDENGDKFEVEMSHVDLVPRCSWEAPTTKVETRMTDEDFLQFSKSFSQRAPMLVPTAYREIANAAIARAIKDGDVVPVVKP